MLREIVGCYFSVDVGRDSWILLQCKKYQDCVDTTLGNNWEGWLDIISGQVPGMKDGYYLGGAK